MKKTVFSGSTLLVIIIVVVLRFVVFTVVDETVNTINDEKITDDTSESIIDPVEWEVKLVVNKIIECIENCEYERWLLEHDKLEEATDSADEVITDEANTYKFLEEFQDKNLYKNQEFADVVGLDMKIFDNKLMEELTNINISIKPGKKADSGTFIDECFTIDINYSKPNKDKYKSATSPKRLPESGKLISYPETVERFGVLGYYFEDIIPEYKRIFGKIIDSIEKYKDENDGSLENLAGMLEISLKPDTEMAEVFDYDSYVYKSDIWGQAEDYEYKLVFDN